MTQFTYQSAAMASPTIRIIWCLLFTVITSTVQAQSVYITAGYLLDPRSGELIENPIVEISGEYIVGVTTHSVDHENEDVIDLGEVTLLPGLADLHTHITFNVDDLGYQGLAISRTDEAVRGVVNARKTLMSGFTIARNLGATGYADVSVREAINSGAIPGPRLQVSGVALSRTGGHCDNNKLPFDYKVSAEGVADGPWAVRAKVRQNHKYGADLIKICATGGTTSRGTKPGVRQYTFEELQSIVDEAHTAGMPVAAHAHGTEGILFAIKAGVDSIEHVSLIDDEGLALAIESGTFLSINAYTPIFMVEKGAAAGMLPESIEKARILGEKRLQTYRKIFKTDAKVVFGSDSATIPHGENAKQFAVYVDLGMTPIQAIRSATTVAAESLGTVGKTGAIDSGYYADIIAVENNPLDDISTLENVIFVMKGGKVYKQ